MKRPAGHTALLLVLATTAAAPLACSQIIGADKKREPAEDAGPSDATNPQVEPVPTGSSTGPPPCASFEKRCDGACVNKDDPLYGCTDDGCDRCSVQYAATIKCSNGKCAPATCQAGRADCNGKGEDGCEADLNDAKTCGNCTTACGAGAPLCTPQGACVADCGSLTQCGASCVDLTSNNAHCSSCNNVCPNVGVNSVPACVASKCTMKCNEGYADCDNNPSTDCTQKKPYYPDNDGDGFAATNAVAVGEACTAPAGHSLLRTDCADNNANVKPGQEQFFATGYTKAAGGTSYDYDCNGVETLVPGKIIGTCSTSCATGYLPAEPPRPGAQNPYCGSTRTVIFCGPIATSTASSSTSSSASASCSTSASSAYSCR